MAKILDSEPKNKTNGPGRPPLHDDLIEDAVSKKKWLHSDTFPETETIRKRAKSLGYSVRTFSAEGGGWNIEIIKEQKVTA
jgi:hypothetical protein